jgi:fructose-1,6-bisphosphatase I
LLYECYPLAFLAEQAGGMVMAEHEAILNNMPTDFHQRSPLLIGSTEMVKACLA